uniref:dTMP kinase n=1 Tax=Arion vulgaris TaxID=1028688 RepID=A0A0B6YQ44_9EUPU
MNGCVKGGIRGALIVFEGCDRSGKSTQCAKLAEKLIADGKKVKLMKFPDRTTPIGQMIDRYLKQTEELDDHTIHLLFSSNRWEAMQKMVNLLKSGTTLIVDRYAYSGVAYSAAKTVNGDASIDALHNEVYNITTEVIKISERLPLLQLWKDETIPNNSNK